MYQIAICEDEQVFSDALKQDCRKLCEKLKIEHTITVFQNSMDFFKAFLLEPEKFDLLLLDIIMDGLNGMELAKKIRRKNKKAAIIFVTSSKDFALQGYEVQALHYLLKPVDPALLETLVAADYRSRFEKNYTLLESRGELLKVFLDEITALETVNRKVAVYLLDKTIYHTGKLNELSDQLPQNIFIRCHQSFALNIRNIRELNKSHAVAVNGKVIPVSRSYLKAVQKAFLEWLGS